MIVLIMPLFFTQGTGAFAWVIADQPAIRDIRSDWFDVGYCALSHGCFLPGISDARIHIGDISNASPQVIFLAWHQ